MKPKVTKNLKAAVVSKLEKKVEAQANVPANLTDDTAAKQLKKDKLAKLKLKKSDQVRQLLLLQKKKEKKAQAPGSASGAPASNQSKENQQKPKQKAPVAQAVHPEPSASSASDPSEPLRDPLLRSEIAAYLRRRSTCTVRLRQLPNRLRLQQIAQLSPGIQALRVPWNYATGRHKGVAYLEYASPEEAKRAAAELAANKTLGVRINASICGISVGGEVANDGENVGEASGGGGGGGDDVDALAGNVDAYNCRRVIVCGLHPHTTGQALKDLVASGSTSPSAAPVKVEFLHGNKQLKKSSPAVAYLTFADEWKAFDAVKRFQGQAIRGRLTSWMLQKHTQRTQQARHRTQLVAFGVSKRVSDDDLLKAFPNSQKIDVRQGKGMAVITYGSEGDCKTDYDRCPAGIVRIGKARLVVQFGHANFKPLEQRTPKHDKQSRQEEVAAKKRLEKQQRPPQLPKKPANIDPSLFHKCQLVVKNFRPSTQDSDLSSFLSGVKRVFFTPNRRLAFVHFNNESAASAALDKLAKEPLNGAKLKAMYAMDKPDKKTVTNTSDAAGADRSDANEAMQVDDAELPDQNEQQQMKKPAKKITVDKKKKKLGLKQQKKQKTSPGVPA